MWLMGKASKTGKVVDATLNFLKLSIASADVEIELKLALDSARAAAFRRHPLLAGGKPLRRQLYSIYFDTPDFDLFKARVALRLRRVGYHWVQTVKAEASTTGTLSARPEWEVRVSGNRPDLNVLPEAARALFRDAWLDRLRPAFVTRFQRTAWHLVLPAGEVEVALDQGEIQAGEMGQVVLPLSEVELELKSGQPEVLFELVDGLAETLPFSLEARSKAQRGYTLCGALKPRPVKAARLDLAPDLPAGQAWQAMIRAALGQFAGNVAGCLAGEDPEYLHQLRVAVRRLRATVSLAKGLGVPAPAWAAELKWLMGEFGPARDWDVFDTETLPRLAGVLGEPAGWPALRTATARRRASANERARAALGSARAVRLVLAIERDLLADHPQALPSGQWAARVLDRRLRRLKRLGKDFEHLDALARHQVRIAAKRLRYAADAFAGLYGDRAAPYLTRLGRLQDALGLANDAAVAAHLLAELRAGSPRLAWLTGLQEGCLLGEASSRQGELARIWQDLLSARPFWKSGRSLRG
jgi:inorganic triphosphatase YgiF